MKFCRVFKTLAFVACFSSLSGVEVSEVMPKSGDSVSMWWADGFPGLIAGAPWHRCVRAGSYGFVLDTEKLEIPFLGPIPKGFAEDDLDRGDEALKRKGQSAQLELLVRVDGKDYRCSRGGRASRYEGPRVIESGRFLQRADVTELEFVAEDGSKLKLEAEFETAAWSDRLGLILTVRPGRDSGAESWKSVVMEVSLKSEGSNSILRERWELPKGQKWSGRERQKVALVIDPVSLKEVAKKSPLSVVAHEVSAGESCPIAYEPALSAHRVSLDGVKAVCAPKSSRADNDVLERVKVVVSNPTDTEQMARLVFERTRGAENHSYGSWITGATMMVRDMRGRPTGLPVQLSKNWHRDREAGTYQGSWFHGITQLRLPPKSHYEFEFTVCYGHWGGLPAASHAQLSLIGWGQNQLWDQSALGSWGESICYDPEQVNAQCSITDVRPVMVTGMKRNEKWGWTNNVGGGDFFRLFTKEGKREVHRSMRAIRHRQGPCLTEVTFAGRMGEGLTHSETVSLARTDDLVRGTYRIRLDVNQPIEFSRFVFFQTGADTYLMTREGSIALGNERGLLKEWKPSWGGEVNRTQPMKCEGKIPWISLHKTVADEKKRGALATRGVVIREWKARLNGQPADPWSVERGVRNSSTVDFVPPPGVMQLQPGDFVEATFEHLVVPQYSKDYYGPNAELKAALAKDENSWRMILREAVGNARQVEVKTGELLRTFPDIRIAAQSDGAEFTLEGGLGFVPVTITHLSSPMRHRLLIDGQEFDQSVHGNDFWQSDFDSKSQTWSRTYNLPATANKSQKVKIEFIP